MGKWHPMSGNFGLFQTEGSIQAEKARKSLQDQIRNVSLREEGVDEYFGNLQEITDEERFLFDEGNRIQRDKNIQAKEASETGYLNSLETFLADSYNIKNESDAKISRANFANASDPMSAFRKKIRRKSIQDAEENQRFKDTSLNYNIASGELGTRSNRLGLDRRELQIGMEKSKAEQNIQDQLFQLREALAEYT